MTGRVFYQTLQASSPSTPSATSFNVSTALFTGLSSGWSESQPSVDITDTSLREWSSSFTVTIDGTTNAQTLVFTSPSGAIQVTDDIESDNYVSGSSGWKIERDTGNAEFQDAIIRGTLNASDISAGTINADRFVGSGIVRLARGSYTDTITLSESIGSSDFSVSLTGVTSGNKILVLGYVRMYYGIQTSCTMASTGHNGDTSLPGGLSAPSGANDSGTFMTSGAANSSTATASFSIIPAGVGSSTVSYDIEIAILEFFT